MYLFKLQLCLDICPGLGLLIVWWLYFCFLKNLHTLSIVAAPVYTATNSVEGSLFHTPSAALVICRLFDNGHSGEYETVHHCSFDLHFLGNQRC